MFEFLLKFSPIILALFGGLFAFLFSVLGAAIVIFFKKVNKNLMDGMIALSSGVMLSAAFFSLLEPAIELSSKMYSSPIFIILIGFITGGLLIYYSNKFFNNYFYNDKFNVSRIFALFTSITLHNIPEGLVIGVAFGSLLYDNSISCLLAAISLTFGIALQNFPEGSAISLPLRREGLSTSKSFLISCLSAAVEPISAIIGAFIVVKVKLFLPFVLTFAAGAMIYVTSMELIPECQENKNKDLMSMLIILGFSIMMILEIILK